MGLPEWMYKEFIKSSPQKNSDKTGEKLLKTTINLKAFIQEKSTKSQ